MNWSEWSSRGSIMCGAVVGGWRGNLLGSARGNCVGTDVEVEGVGRRTIAVVVVVLVLDVEVVVDIGGT